VVSACCEQIFISSFLFTNYTVVGWECIFCGCQTIKQAALKVGIKHTKDWWLSQSIAVDAKR